MTEDESALDEQHDTPSTTWLKRRLDVRALRVAVGADLREFALLWLVFALLDMMIANRLTPKWALVNGLFTLVAWGFGAYIEMRRSTGEV